MSTTSPQTFNISLTQHTYWFSGNVPGWSLGNVSQCKLFDNFQFTPPTSNDFETKLGMHIINCTWARRGEFWLGSSLNFAGTFNTASGASGSIALNTGVFWQPMKSLTLSFAVTLDGTVDNAGFHGSVQFHQSNATLVLPKSQWAGVGVYF
jgi:hypothetical protein